MKVEVALIEEWPVLACHADDDGRYEIPDEMFDALVKARVSAHQLSVKVAEHVRDNYPATDSTVNRIVRLFLREEQRQPIARDK